MRARESHKHVIGQIFVFGEKKKTYSEFEMVFCASYLGGRRGLDSLTMWLVALVQPTREGSEKFFKRRLGKKPGGKGKKRKGRFLDDAHLLTTRFTSLLHFDITLLSLLLPSDFFCSPSTSLSSFIKKIKIIKSLVINPTPHPPTSKNTPRAPVGGESWVPPSTLVLVVPVLAHCPRAIV